MTIADPFHVEGPACISVSGGRSSGLMLHRILAAHGGTLPSDVHCVFANTGEEAEGTLVFIREMSRRWGVPIRWVEFTAERRADPRTRAGDDGLLAGECPSTHTCSARNG